MKSKSTEGVGWGEAIVVFENSPDIIVGRVLTLVEAAGLPSKQEESLKHLIRQAVWDVLTDDCIRISGERHTELRNLQAESRIHSDGTPSPAI